MHRPFRAEPRAGAAVPSPAVFRQARTPAKVPLKTQLAFERQGHCVLSNSLPADQLQHLKRLVQAHVSSGELAALQHRVRVLVSPKAAASCKSKADAKRLLAQHQAAVGFLQFFNLHR